MPGTNSKRKEDLMKVTVDKIENGKKSYAISFTLRDDDKTLTDKQIDKVMTKLSKAFEKELNAVIRGA